ncbi:MAG: hypothetical protein K2J71_04750 [Oscillospiraceae bacterium]|nr:hypothetical protein [Oscillospiraceae bacterium]
MALTTEEALYFLGIDYADEMITANVNDAISMADAVLKGAIGDDVFQYFPDDPRLKHLQKLYTADAYNERYLQLSSNTKSANAQRYQIQTLELQLKLELRRKKEELV